MFLWQIAEWRAVRGEKQRRAAQRVSMEQPALDADLLPVPRGLECQICLELLQDPVTTVDGHSYCRECILESRRTACGIRFGSEAHASAQLMFNQCEKLC